MKTRSTVKRLRPEQAAGTEHWTKLAERLDEIVLIWDKKGSLLMYNKRAVDLLGYSREEFRNIKYEQLFPAHPARLTGVYNKVRSDAEVNLKTDCLNKQEQAIPVRLCIFQMPYEGKEAVMTLVRCLAPQQRAQELVKEYAEKLTRQKNKLKRMEKIVRGLIRFIPKEHQRVKKQIQLAIEQLLLPLLEKLKMETANSANNAHNTGIETLDLLEKTINQFTAAFGGKAAGKLLKLTQKELEICNLIRQGFSTKEIAGYLNLSCRTVENHRNNICKKLGLTEHKVKLATYLKNMVLRE